MLASDAELDALRASMPRVLEMRCGVTDVRRAFACPDPAHEDSDPSARYYADKHLVHCFGCGRTWDVFQLVGMLDGVEGFSAQVGAVARCVGMALRGGVVTRRDGRAAGRRAEPPRPAGGADCGDACRAAYERAFTAEGDVARRWLRYRGLGDECLARYGLGFCADPREVMPEFRCCEPEALGFVTIPFWERDGLRCRYAMCRTLCAYGARNKEWRPCGLASPLWREWLLSSAEPVVCVTEGPIDAMALERLVGVPTVALGGVGCAPRLASVLAAVPVLVRPRRVVVAMDEDDAGRSARDRVLRDLRGTAWDFAEVAPARGGCSSVVMAGWSDGR